ncbi:MAG: hypothetical protein KBG84_11465, partial [Planctomycetes bacterium]|nr:hypothetical protein [Planctomycetota bacterium]
MQGLARFSLVAVIVLAAILLGSWAYLTARYGSIEEYMVSEDGPYWRPGSPSEAHDDVETDEGRSLTERTADSVKAGKIPEDENGDWRKTEPEKARPETERAPKGGDAAPQNTIEARIDT